MIMSDLFCTKCSQIIKGRPYGTISTPYCKSCFYVLFRSEKEFWELKQNTPTIEMIKAEADKAYRKFLLIVGGIIIASFLIGLVIGLTSNGTTLEKMYNECNNNCKGLNYGTAQAWGFNSTCICSSGKILPMPPQYIVAK
jgi:hypothetical protein